MRRLNREILDRVYEYSELMSKSPLILILTIWIPMISLILLMNYNYDLFSNVMILSSILVIYVTSIVIKDRKRRYQKYNELRDLGVEVFGSESKFKFWLYYGCLNEIKIIDLDIDKTREILNKMLIK